MNASNYLEVAILEHFLRGNTQNSPQNRFFALYISDPTDADTGTEVTGSGYARQQVSFGPVSQVGGKGTLANTAKIEFPVAGGAWGTVAYWGVRDALTGGNLLVHGALSASKAVAVSDQLVFQAGDITVSAD